MLQRVTFLWSCLNIIRRVHYSRPVDVSLAYKAIIKPNFNPKPKISFKQQIES